jgi:mannose-1-phosphate guanylyltransferase
MFDHYYAVIMAGGGGTRLWPLSRQSRPKQMLSLFDERTLFQMAVQRLSGVFPAERILVVTVADQVQQLITQCPELPVENFLIEPKARGTASVAGLAALALLYRDPQAVMAILTADQYMGNIPLYHQLLNAAYLAAQDGYLVTLGIEPTYAATGFGYIQQADRLDTYGGLDVYRVARFKEKPDLEQAQTMLADGNHTWNSGMFVWHIDRVMAEIERQLPQLSTGLKEISASREQADYATVLERVWLGLKNQTIDYGIMEGAARVVVIPAMGLEWNDVGTWDSLFEVLTSDANGNIVKGTRCISLDSSKTLVYGQENHQLIVTIGVQDLVIVDTGDVLLVCQKDQAQRVRHVVEQLKKDGQQYL